MQFYRRLLAIAAVFVPLAIATAADDPIVTEGYPRCTVVDDNADIAKKRDWCTAVLRKIPATDPRVPLLFASRGQARADLGAHADALKDLDRAIAAEPATSVFRYWRGLTHQKARRLDLAIADYTKAIELEEDTPGAWINRAMIHAQLGDHDQAAAGLDHILDLRPDHVVAMANRSNINAYRGRLKEAEGDIRRLEEIAPTFPGTIWARSLLHSQKREFERALVGLNKLAATAPEAGVFTARAATYAYLQKFDRARADIAAAKRGKTPFGYCVECWLVEAFVLTRQRHFGQAGAIVDAAFKKYPDEWRVKTMRCLTRNGEDRLAEALVACDEAIKSRPKPYAAYTNRASVHLKLGNLDAALADYDTALKLGEWTGLAHFGRGLVLRRKGDLKKGDAAIALARKMFPKVDEEFALVGLKP